MRIYSFAFLVSTAVPTRCNCDSEGPGLWMTGANPTASVPISVDDSNHAPVSRLSKAHTWNSEERAPRSIPLEAAIAPQAVKKNIMFKLYGGISRQKLTLDGWRHVISHDDKTLTRVVDQRLLFDDEENVEVLRSMVKTAVAKLKMQYTSEIKNHLTIWIKHQPPERLVASLKEIGFFLNLNPLTFQALDKSIGESNKAMLFNTLSEGFNGMANFASALSIAKQSLVTGHDAKSIQSSLLAFWEEEKKPISEVIKLLDLEKKDWIYETLDALVEYVALRTDKPKDVFPDMIEHLRESFGLEKVVENVMKEHSNIHPVASPLRETYGDSVTAGGKEHDEFAKQLQTGLLCVLFKKGMDPSYLVNNPYHLLGVYAKQLEAEYTAYYEKRLQLSLRPPET